MLRHERGSNTGQLEPMVIFKEVHIIILPVIYIRLDKNMFLHENHSLGIITEHSKQRFARFLEIKHISDLTNTF